MPVDVPRSTGPSPRVRGAAQQGLPRLHFLGAIPAGAGSSWALAMGSPSEGGHPREYGEQTAATQALTPYEGPSPRVRGAVIPPRVQDRAGGAIPAGAGSRSPAPTACRARWGHPRGCGEQGFRWDIDGRARGPSPRVRGAVGLLRSERVYRRGHPSGCGEQRPEQREQIRAVGPSPRVRGAGRGPREVGRCRGAIPAGAGAVVVVPRVAAAGGAIPAGAGSRRSPGCSGWCCRGHRWRPAVWCRGSSRLSARVLLPGVHRLPVSAPCSTGRPPCNCPE